ncbi:hypothetical protein F4779DRAFT_600412 [Xylariaceae sp. FL0662B]|nr:hypothetical protein F4779DRAFT_600412 [Xylariaceae sp. FL0662B]
MLVQPVIHGPIDPQLESALFLAPIEIRHVIYTYLIGGVHLFFRHGKIHISACLDPDPSGDLDGFERQTTGGWRTDTIWRRRLGSPWGPHWKCEEAASGTVKDVSNECGTLVAILSACKRMHAEVTEFMAGVVVFNVTDLDTLGCLLERASASSIRPCSTSDFLTPIPQRIRKLDITLRLPLHLLKALEYVGINPRSKSPLARLSRVRAWLQVWPAMARLKGLGSLRIWLDHDDRSSWSIVNERDIVSHLTPLTTIPDLNVVVSLPKLHPRLEKADRHFAEDTPASAFKITRRLRQRYHPGEDSEGHTCVIYSPDFPTLGGYPGFEDAPLEELEKIERDLIKRGIDIDDFYAWGQDGAWQCMG